MIHANMMYLRPGNLFHDFIIEDTTQEINSKGRAVLKHTGDGTKIIRGCLAEATDIEREKHGNKEHTITHIIVQKGAPKAKRTDKLILKDRVFYIVDVDEAGSLGISTLYYAEERVDVK